MLPAVLQKRQNTFVRLQEHERAGEEIVEVERVFFLERILICAPHLCDGTLAI